MNPLNGIPLSGFHCIEQIMKLKKTANKPKNIVVENSGNFYFATSQLKL
jgi:hypothetical protein